MQCTSKLGEMLSLARNTPDEFDRTLTKIIGVASDADFPVRAARDCQSGSIDAGQVSEIGCAGRPRQTHLAVGKEAPGASRRSRSGCRA